jgi:hypothetical protein
MHRYHRSPRHPFALAFALFAVTLPLARISAAEIRNHASVGYDSFVDRYTILDTDTVETVQELYFGFGNSLHYKNGATKAGVGSLFRYGNQTVDENVDIDGTFSPAHSTLLDVRGNVHWRHFQKGSDYDFGNDFMQADAIGRIRRSFGEYAHMDLRSRVEIVDYLRRTEFDYDYRYFDVGAQIEAGPDLNRMVLFGVTVGSRTVSDTTALSFDRILTELEARITLSRSLSVHLATAGDRRDYRDNVRSSFWSVLSFLDASFGDAAGAIYSLRGESEFTSFDKPDATYFDTHFLRWGLRARLPVRTLLDVVLEPRYARMLCRDIEEERYAEYSFVMGSEIMRNGGFWITLSYEFGYRNYTLAENEIYSDFYLHRLGAMSSVPLPGQTELSILISSEPERHSRREDDFSVTLVSIDLAKRF